MWADNSEEFKTLLVAKMACDSNPDCVGIYNRQCNGKGFMLCYLNSDLSKYQFLS